MHQYAVAARLGVVLCTAVVLAAATVVVPPASAQGGPLLVETFRNATADPAFVAYGSACLTGAAPADPPAGEHRLAGCHADGTGPVPPTGADGYGFVQLTDAANDQAGAALFEQPIPADQGLIVTFEQWQYGSTTTGTNQRPADGIAFFLTDGTADLDAPGAFGGSLGYAQKLPDDDSTNPFLPGVNGGYLGIGLDYLGNYFGDWEQRGLGCTGSGRSPAGTAFRGFDTEPNKITVRGPGNGTRGYCFITSTATNLDSTTGPWDSTLPLSLRSDVDAVPDDPQGADAVLVPQRRTVRIEITPAPNPIVTVSIAVAGEPLEQVLSFPAPEPVPHSYKFGFSASTGAFTDIHLIRNVAMESELPTPALELAKEVVTPAPYRAGDTVTYRYTVTNTGLADVADLRIIDDRIGSVDCPVTTLTSREEPTTASTVCTGSYVLTAADAAAGVVRNVARAEAEGGGVVSNEDAATIRLEPAPATVHLTTHTSDRRVSPGTAFRDRVHLTGVAGSGGVAATADLYGPFPRRSAAVCDAGHLARTVTWRAHNGTSHSPPVRVHAPGFYTWRVATAADERNLPAIDACGRRRETTLVAKRPYPSPVIDGGFSGTLPAPISARQAPTLIRMPATGMRAPVTAGGVRHGAMVLPGDVHRVGWLRRSAAPGDAIGTTVIAGHVSDRHDRPGAMHALSTARKGQVVTITKNGRTHRFKVVATASYPRAEKLPHRYFATTGRHRLVLVSCTDRAVYANGHFHYSRYEVVLAKPIR